MAELDTAPRDGTHILLQIDGLWIEGYWREPNNVFGQFQYPGSWEVIRVPSHGCGCCGDNDPEPSAWAPLP